MRREGDDALEGNEVVVRDIEDMILSCILHKSAVSIAFFKFVDVVLTNHTSASKRTFLIVTNITERHQ